MMIKEHNIRNKAKEVAEYITGTELRKYLAEKVKKYIKGSISVFDGAIGSGQLEQYLDVKEIIGVDIQKEAIETAKENYKHILNNLQVKSFFDYVDDVKVDTVIMNPPFSLKFNELPYNEKQNIKDEFKFKKSGLLDEIFVLKSLKYAKRFAFYILFPGVGYRKTEKHFREIIGSKVLELNKIDNAFENTDISVLFLIIDKEKTTDDYYTEIFDCKQQKVLYSENNKLELKDNYNWRLCEIPQTKEHINIDELNETLNNACIENVKNHLEKTIFLIAFLNADIDFMQIIERLNNVIAEYKEIYNQLIKS